MPNVPRIPKQVAAFTTKKCDKCGAIKLPNDFAKAHSFFFIDGYLPVCNECITKYLSEYEFNWEAVDRICQWSGIPFIPKEFERLHELNGDMFVWEVYANVFASADYDSLDWGDYFRQFQALKAAGVIADELPLLAEEKLHELQKKWGSNYSEEELEYLEDLYKGILSSQNVTGALQIDQAKKICKLSLEIDSRIRAGDKDVDKFMASYDKMTKAAEFTPKNVKNAVDFDSIAELAFWLEKRGRINKFYDNTTRDVIDETLKNIENWNQRLYTNEGGLGEAITERLNALKVTQEDDNYYDLQKEFDTDKYDNEAFTVEGEEEDFEEEYTGDGTI